MKRIAATVLFLSATALSTAAVAESPTQREMHSWGFVQQVAYPPQAQNEAPVIERREERPYHNNHMEGKHHGKHHTGKHHDHAAHEHAHKGKAAHHGKHHHHHHKDDKASTNTPAQSQPKQ